MKFVLPPWHLLLTILAGLIHRQQQEVIEYLRTENQILKEGHGKRRIRLNDDQRRRLAVKGKVLGRKVLGEIGAAFSPDTIIRWHRQLVAEKWDYSDDRGTAGGPRIKPEIVELVLRMARVNPSWGYDRIQGALDNLGHKISGTTSATSSESTGSNRLRNEGGNRPRRNSWKRIGTCSAPSTSRRSRSGRSPAWSPSTCSSSWR